ncbi:glycosyltransferase family 4 protein [Vitreimonas flagellata]|uniref:glycosyltransferase family 4 protein n=1 Tax=Vitreimonas flagellata TaxID=2560861 RepID=UPI00107567AD|nr:glycosyltransferase family 4 protein [Vitreimonas flagellata]
MRPIIWSYLGRRGALARFTLDLARALAADKSAIFVVSEHNERAAELRSSGAEVHFAPGFATPIAGMNPHLILRSRRFFREVLGQVRPYAVVELMGHVWSPFVEDLIREVGAKRTAILHDFRGHPGDLSGLFTSWIGASAFRSDLLLTLSRAVAYDIVTARPKLRPEALFHPWFQAPLTPIPQHGPLRMLFVGRLLQYRGLDLFVEGAELARERGVDLRVGVFGAGNISQLRGRLEALGAEVVNRWLKDDELDAVLARYDLVLATHREASQSGVVALGAGAGRPAIVTPVGGLPEQISQGQTGLVARSLEGAAIADAIVQFSDRAFLARCHQEIQSRAAQWSMRAFAEAVSRAVRA